MIKRLLCCALCLCLMLGVSACEGTKTPTNDETQAKLTKFEDVFYEAFDATITVTAYCENEEQFRQLLDTVKSEFIRYHKLYDIYFSYSGISNIKTINDNAGKAPVKVSQEIIELIDFAKNMYALTDGSVNIAFGSVLKLWHEAREYNNAVGVEKKLPDEEALRAAAEHCNIDDVIVDEDADTVYLNDPQMSLDVGSVAKGYATEKVAKLIEAQGYEHVTLNAGGNVRTVGLKPGGEKWHIAVTNPDTSSGTAYIDVVETGSAAVVTSGVYQRYFEYNGRRYHHIIDGDTLMPEERYLSVTILTDDSGFADALSTAVFNMDFEKGCAFVESLDNVEALWVFADKTVKSTPGFHNFG